jgi:hypothetical protein
MFNPSKRQRKWLIAAGFPWLLLACMIGGPARTALPPARPANFEIQTATPTSSLPEEVEETGPGGQEAAVLMLGDAPTHTPDPNAPPTIPPLPTNTPVPVIVTFAAEVTPTVEITPAEEAAPAAAPARVVVSEPDPPLKGGDWDFEAEFIPWSNPHGEPCPGARVASGWTAFVEDGPYGSSCMNENLYQPNVMSGAKSQEITFDFISANSGVFRTIPIKVGHRYSIEAHAKHDRSLSPVEMALGVDLTGGSVWSDPTVSWFAWDGGAEDTWVATEETITATGDTMTIFIKGFHPLAEQGGKTVIDNVSVTDLGP